MNRKLALLAATLLATTPALTTQALAQTQQQRAQAVQGQTGQAPNAPASTGARAEVTTTAEFLRLAAMSDRYETASGRLAGEKSQNARVKEFALMLVRDHSQTTQQLQTLMQQVPGMGAGAATPLPQGRETTGNAESGRITNAQGGPQHEGLDQQHTALLQQLQGVSGAEFDRLFLSQQVTMHQQAVDLFGNYSRSGDNPQLKQFATQTLPHLQEHLRMAQQLQQATQG
jgi:putative membrane protein